MRFDGKLAIVTGGASGIGRSSATKFAALGAKLLLADLDADGLAQTAATIRDAGGSVEIFVGDMTDTGAVQALLGQAAAIHPTLDVIHANAGIQGAIGPVYSYDVEAYDQVMAVNTRSVFLMLRFALPMMIAQQSGTIVVTCSVASLGGMPALPAYVASKHAALGLVRSAAMDVANTGVRVNGVCPGAVETPMLQSILAKMNPDAPEEAAARFAASSPIGRLISPDEIADAVLYLSSDAARSITGAYLSVDGGLSTRLGGATRS